MRKIPRDPDAWKLKRRRAGAHVSRPERSEVEREALADQAAPVSRPEHGRADFPSMTDPEELLRQAVAEGAVDRARERLLRRALEADFRRPVGVDPSQLAPSAPSGEIGPGAGSPEGVG